MAAGEIRRAVIGRIPENLRNCVNKEYLSQGTDEFIYVTIDLIEVL